MSQKTAEQQGTGPFPALRLVNELPAIRSWHVCISGFRQQTGEPTGLQRLWLKLGERRDPETCVFLEPWDLDYDNLAELIWLCRPAWRPPTVRIYGYSWGGYSAVLLARALRSRGIGVRHLVLCDAVYRHRYWLGQWRAFVGWPKIRVPDNVREVFWWRQKGNWPRGHDVVAKDPQKTKIHDPYVAICTHHYMDELESFQQTALTLAALKSS
ncbi:MAG TPA: hypothetical protein VMY42_14950 [Thermoguttaceae bacterium]|nr:hypothetical protein [Thermoguttaceae bacterium]